MTAADVMAWALAVLAWFVALLALAAASAVTVDLIRGRRNW